MPTDMILNILNLIATSVLAYAAIRIASQANRISHRAVKVEADKHLFEWGQRCLNCFSRICSLRLRKEENIADQGFEEQRRLLLAELFALKEEGALFFEKNGAESTEPSLVALGNICALLKPKNFQSPKKADFDTRRAQIKSIRDEVRIFLPAVQSRVDSEWVDK